MSSKKEFVLEWIIVDYGKDGDGSVARTTGLVTYALASLFATKGPDFCGLDSGVYAPECVNEETRNTCSTSSKSMMYPSHNIGSSQCGTRHW